MRPVLCVLAAWLLGGCFAEGYSMKDRLTEAARKFNEGVRWNKVDQSIEYLPKDEQKRFVEVALRTGGYRGLAAVSKKEQGVVWPKATGR